jgi:hypothetical protein
MRGVETAGLSPASASRYRMGSFQRMKRVISGRQVRVIVYSALGIVAVDQETGGPNRDLEGLILASGYRQLAKVGLTSVYVRRGAERH